MERSGWVVWVVQEPAEWVSDTLPVEKEKKRSLFLIGVDES